MKACEGIQRGRFAAGSAWNQTTIMRGAGGQGRGRRFGADGGVGGVRTQLDILGRLVHDLGLVLVEIETGVKLRLFCEKIFQAGFVFEGTT